MTGSSNGGKREEDKVMAEIERAPGFRPTLDGQNDRFKYIYDDMRKRIKEIKAKYRIVSKNEE